MTLHIFSTDIKSKKKVKRIRPLLNNHSKVTNWNVDLEDVDKVLRVEGKDTLSESELVQILNFQGFQIEPLPD